MRHWTAEAERESGGQSRRAKVWPGPLGALPLSCHRTHRYLALSSSPTRVRRVAHKKHNRARGETRNPELTLHNVLSLMSIASCRSLTLSPSWHSSQYDLWPPAGEFVCTESLTGFRVAGSVPKDHVRRGTSGRLAERRPGCRLTHTGGRCGKSDCQDREQRFHWCLSTPARTTRPLALTPWPHTPRGTRLVSLRRDPRTSQCSSRLLDVDLLLPLSH